MGISDFVPTGSPVHRQKFLYSVPEVASGFGCSERFVWKEIHGGRLGHTRLGRRVGVSPKQIDDYVGRNSSDPFDAVAKAAEIVTTARSSRNRSK